MLNNNSIVNSSDLAQEKGISNSFLLCMCVCKAHKNSTQPNALIDIKIPLNGLPHDTDLEQGDQ